MAMQHGADKTGPARDDMMKKQLRGELNADRSLRTDEEHELQPSGEDQPAVARDPAAESGTGAPAGTGVPRGMTERDVSIRSDLARHLGRGIYPADRSAVLESLREHHAPDRLLDLADRLPDSERYENVQAVAASLGLGTEHGRS
ncbi:DUF2795 domain-containing protein [Streptomyces sp. NPDC050617]|uniref:DUF2795 domain-containing protein n=1 Tax=Streptomyces sp. NPDC050617 TaxID=3154628 RepID=UPI0034183D59